MTSRFTSETCPEFVLSSENGTQQLCSGRLSLTSYAMCIGCLHSVLVSLCPSIGIRVHIGWIVTPQFVLEQRTRAMWYRLFRSSGIWRSKGQLPVAQAF